MNMSTHEPIVDTRFMRGAELARRWGCSQMTLLRMRRRGTLPEPTRLSPGVVAWRLDIIEALERERTPQTDTAA